ncbi:hypothetical protein CYMTET_14618 [Cymbomonas tetramitiformis]|uniref:Uncharacterized protein n=1 Tax=Cymbomonas tetramitiformis TaxID=36881 RepID=A0AAE0LA69_9CHLO|nr:hypothetical protein CYMTET_14618 [Cymbomonas tetramitiformis]
MALQATLAALQSRHAGDDYDDQDDLDLASHREVGRANRDTKEDAGGQITTEVAAQQGSQAGSLNDGDAVITDRVDNEKLALNLIQQYVERENIRVSYVQLFSFIVNFMVFITILSLQNKAQEEFDVLEGFRESFLPQDENGDPQDVFNSRADIWDWLAGTVSQYWQEPFCGDGVCEDPLEFPAFAEYGCKADCGSYKVTQVTLHLTAIGLRLVDDAKTQEVTWNLCPLEDLSRCWWSDAATLAAGETFHDSFDVPDGEWVVVATLGAGISLYTGSLTTEQGLDDTDATNATNATNAWNATTAPPPEETDSAAQTLTPPPPPSSGVTNESTTPPPPSSGVTSESTTPPPPSSNVTEESGNPEYSDNSESAGEAGEYSDSSESAGEAGENNDSSESAGEAGENSDSSESAGEAGEYSDSSESAGEAGEYSDSSESAGEAGEYSDSSESAGEAGGNSDDVTRKALRTGDVRRQLGDWDYEELYYYDDGCEYTSCQGHSNWTQWELDIASEEVAVSSAETCDALLQNLESNTSSDLLQSCGSASTSWANSSLQLNECCQVYKPLLDSYCWCTIIGYDQGFEWESDFSSDPMRMSLKNRGWLSECADTVPDTAPLRVPATCNDGEGCRAHPLYATTYSYSSIQCPLHPAVNTSSGVNAVACRHEFAWLFEQSETLQSEYLFRCTTSSYGTDSYGTDSFGWDDSDDSYGYSDNSASSDAEWCCSAIRPVAEYNCMCFDASQPGYPHDNRDGTTSQSAHMSELRQALLTCGYAVPECEDLDQTTIYHPGPYTVQLSTPQTSFDEYGGESKAYGTFREFHEPWLLWYNNQHIYDTAREEEIPASVEWERHGVLPALCVRAG